MTDTSSSFRIVDLPTVFADVAPVPQDDGPVAVCRIDYPPPFTQAFDYFRAMLRQPEYSPRVLQLTTLCLHQNPANYTVWHYRRLCLYELADWTSHIPEDLALAAELGGNNPKNYQIWYHRRALLEAACRQPEEGGRTLTDYAPEELQYIAKVLEADGKNYHAWSHRQWLLLALNDDKVWDKELAYTHDLIQTDVRNNSAWNQRWFALHRGKPQQALSLDAQTQAEVDYAMEQAARDPYNESPFRYLMALWKQVAKTVDEAPWKQDILPTLQDKVAALGSQLANDGRESSSFVLSTQVDLYELQGDAESLTTAQSLLNELAETVDPIRRKYWALRHEQIERKKA
jgi:protein farnesyltransferase/geranylgeranyltransferase type-1 subunit alpha